MKIAIFTDLYTPWAIGGIPSSIKAQKADLEAAGHEVVVFCPGAGAREKGVVNVPTHRWLKINGAALSKRPSKVEQFVLTKYPDFVEFDLVHVHYEASCSIAGVRLARRWGIPLVQTMHGREDMAIAINVPVGLRGLVARVLCKQHAKLLPHQIRVKKDRFQAPTKARARMWELMVNHAEYADVVLTPTNHFGKKLEHYGVSKPIVVVSNGVAPELVQREFAVRELADGAVLKMLWNSRVSNEKRMMEFLAALRLLKRPYIVYIYGNGNCLKRAERYAARHDLKVKFYGVRKREKILEAMGKVHLAVMASYNFDTQGMTLLEAEATGLPVFFCDPAMEEVVPAGSYVLSDGPEPESMAIALQSFPAERIAEMSRVMMDSREQVMQATQTAQLLQAYDLALGRRPQVVKED